MKNRGLKEKLDFYYELFDRSRISPDPLEFPHRYNNPSDIEISGLISSVFAYGNIKQIISILEKLNAIMSGSPYSFVLNYDKNLGCSFFNLLKHRFYSGDDISRLFLALNNIYNKYESLESFFMAGHTGDSIDIKERLSVFSGNMTGIMSKGKSVSYGIRFMFPDPMKGSGCKRVNLFLRWMVRKDDLDFGIWKRIPASKLIIPVDTHVARICQKLKLTGKKNISWLMAEEITGKLSKFDPDDPVKYDFAICHIGMRKMKF
ncbi:MAG TPA: TIGR02757 family protein [Melioribacteraceae bacterium]|nr:TIGR02757 family protein [Melioribacteraceae bacterium]